MSLTAALLIGSLHLMVARCIPAANMIRLLAQIGASLNFGSQICEGLTLPVLIFSGSH